MKIRLLFRSLVFEAEIAMVPGAQISVKTGAPLDCHPCNQLKCQETCSSAVPGSSSSAQLSSFLCLPFLKVELLPQALRWPPATSAKIGMVFPGYPQMHPHTPLNRRECQPILQVKHHQFKLFDQGHRTKITKPEFDSTSCIPQPSAPASCYLWSGTTEVLCFNCSHFEMQINNHKNIQSTKRHNLKIYSFWSEESI